ncbi:MAG: glycogen synthase [Chthoniobacterales bacterium]|nr:glycogen synthase [Chthoniobacterales bacterium]
MKLLLFTKEYPPHIYGGAGVHVKYLSRELAKLISVEVRCFGDQQEKKEHFSIRGFSEKGLVLDSPPQLKSPLDAAWRGIQFNAAGIDADLVHCHTWYTYLGGIMAKQLYGIPLIITVHSLEPLRPWKQEQLGGGYDYSCWIEQQALTLADAVIAVSHETKRDILEHFPISEDRVFVIHNGIDLNEYSKNQERSCLEKYGINSDLPYVLFVGRITRQKGIVHLVHAIKHMDPGFQIVLCAGAPDTPEIALEMEKAVAQAQEDRPGIIWISTMVEHHDIIALYSGAALFVCPSIYEPFGIINLEAMACGVPVVASAVGGIKEVVVDGVTGFLVPLDQKKGGSDILDPENFILTLAARVNQLMSDSSLRASMGAAGRLRVEHHFSWEMIAKKTERLYTHILKESKNVH